MNPTIEELEKALRAARTRLRDALEYEEQRRADWNLISVLNHFDARLTRIEEKLRVGT